MKISIGIDVGISTTKIVGIREGKVIKPLRIKATDPVTSLYGAFGKYLYDNRIDLSEVERVMLTGVGAHYIDKPVYGLPTAKADEFINRLEGGYQYMISQGGTNLSGGQRQRLAMARALVRKPDLFIFDDSFSALDGTTERAVRTALQEELQKDNRPALISVEQKVSAAKKADHILIINRGQVAGYGTHDELATTSTVYQQILASQEVTA